MKHIKKIEVTKAVYNKYWKRDGSVRCFNCPDPIKIGDEVVSKVIGGGLNRKNVLYCMGCSEELNLW